MKQNESNSYSSSQSSLIPDREDSSELIAAICDDFSARQRAGEQASVEDYVLAYPDREHDIRTAISAIQAMKVTAESKAVQLPETTIPDKIGRFQIVRRLGAGAMGIVYEATHPTVSRRIAIKVLKTETSAATGFRERFIREAEAASRLNHPNIVPFFDYGEDGNVAYMSMMYVDGISVDQLLKRYWMAEPGESFVGRDFAKIARIGADVAAALAHAHSLETIHRDIKPANLLLDSNGKVWVADFGLAMLRDEDSALSTAGQMVGTPRYMAPEQLRGIAGERSDIYSLGITLLELVSAGPVWTTGGSAEETGCVDASAILKPNRNVPPKLAKIIAKACAHSPEKRYAKASDLQFALNQFAHGGGKTDRRSESRSGIKGKLRDIVLAIGLTSALTLAAFLAIPNSATTTDKKINSPIAKIELPNLIPEFASIETVEASVVEGSTEISDLLLTGSDPNGDPFSWQLAKSADSEAFVVQALSGHLCLKTPAWVTTATGTNTDKTFKLALMASDFCQPHVAVFAVDGTTGDVLVTEPALGIRRSLQLPRQMLCVCTSDGQTILHAHLSKDGTVALYESVIGPINGNLNTQLIQSNCKLSPFTQGLAQGPNSTFLAIVKTRQSHELQWLGLNKDGSFQVMGEPLPIECFNPIGLSSLGEYDFQLLESSDDGTIAISELAVTNTQIVGRRELPAGWKSRERILGMVAWTEKRPLISQPPKRQNVSVRVRPRPTD